MKLKVNKSTFTYVYCSISQHMITIHQWLLMEKPHNIRKDYLEFARSPSTEQAILQKCHEYLHVSVNFFLDTSRSRFHDLYHFHMSAENNYNESSIQLLSSRTVQGVGRKDRLSGLHINHKVIHICSPNTQYKSNRKL